MDAVSYSHADKQKQRIEKIIANPDSTSGIVTVPKVIGAGENITVPAGRVAVLPNIQVDGTLNVEGEVFIPSGTTFSKVVNTEGNQTIAGVKTFSSSPIVPTPTAGTQVANKDYVDTKVSKDGTGATGTWGINITGNAETARNVLGGKASVLGTGNDYYLGGVEVLGNGIANTVFPTIGFNQPGLYASSLQLRGGGDFRFYTQGGESYGNVTANTFIGTLSGNAATATKLSTTNTNWSTNGTIDNAVGMLAWKNYGNNHVIFDASNGTSPSGKPIDNVNPEAEWIKTYPTLMGWNGYTTYGVRVDSARIADAFSTTSGSAPSYACRAWVNFNGTGTVAIRASGNVSSITDNGTGNYTVNFTTAMPDANYSVALSSRQDGDANENAYNIRVRRVEHFSTTGVSLSHGYYVTTNVYTDCLYGLVSIFR